MTDEDVDEAMILRFKDGDERAFADLVSRHKEPLHRFIFRYVQDHAEAEALLFDCFIRAWRGRLSYERTAQFQTWLFSIAINLCRDYGRKRTRRPGDFASTSVEFCAERDGAPSDSDPSGIAEMNEDVEKLRQEINALPHDQKTALVLFALEGRSQEEVSKMLGCSVKAVETRIYHARRELRRRLGNAQEG